jgi:hypothetical protein
MGGPNIGGPEMGPGMGQGEGPPIGPDDHNGHWGPPQGEQSELVTVDSSMHQCSPSTSSLLGPSTLDCSISAFSIITTGSYFDFIARDGMSLNEANVDSSSPSTISSLLLWSLSGLMSGLGAFFAFAYYTNMDIFGGSHDRARFNPSQSRANPYMQQAEEEVLSESKHSDHGLLMTSLFPSPRADSES